jgi:seryl-tRNA synthetase
VHTLNGTAAVGRMVLAILENFQGEVPVALQRFGAPARISA